MFLSGRLCKSMQMSPQPPNRGSVTLRQIQAQALNLFLTSIQAIALKNIEYTNLQVFVLISSKLKC